MKKYYHLVIATRYGKTVQQDLTLSEIKLLPEILRENNSVTIELHECSKEAYIQKFGL